MRHKHYFVVHAYDPVRRMFGWAVRDERTGRDGEVWSTEREAEIDLARILIRDLMHG